MTGYLQEGTRGQGSAGLFATTHWSVVLRAQDKSEAALATLCEDYRQPMIVWLRARGSTPHDAEDSIQGFLAHALSRQFLENVAKEKGKFRTFLLTSLQNYIKDDHSKRVAEKRGGGETIASLDETDEAGHKLHDPATTEAAPDLEYDRAWAKAVLENVKRRLIQECAVQGHQALYSEVEPVMFRDETATPYREIGARLGMSEDAVKTAAHRIRNRLKALVREELLQTVTNEQDLQEEVRYLIQLFAR